MQWGRQKNITFHSDEGLRLVQAKAQSRSVCFERAGHWLMHSHTDQFLDELNPFLAQILG